MNTLEAIMADLFELEPSLKEKEPQVRAIVSAMLKAKPDTQFDQSFADNLKAQLLATTPDNAPATRRAWYLSVPAWSLASVSAAVLLLVAVAQLDLTPAATINAPTSSLLGTEAFGRLNFTSVASTGMERGGGGESVLGADDWMPTIYEYALPDDWTQHITLPAEAPVYTVGRGTINGDIGSLLNLPTLNKLNLSLFGLNAETADHSLSATYDTVNNALYLLFNNNNSGPAQLTENHDVLPEEQLIAKARTYAEQYGASLANTAAPFVNDQSYILYARADATQRESMLSTFVPTSNVTIIFRQTLDGATPVYYTGETQVTVNAQTGELVGLSFPLDWHTASESTYRTITDTNQIATYFRWGGTVDPATWYPEQTVQKQIVHLGQPKLIYSRQWLCDETNTQCSDYLVPSLSAPARDGQLGWMNEVTIPLSTNSQ